MTRPARSWIPEYELTTKAECDLLKIARYTSRAWGVQQAQRYEAALETRFTAIGRGEVRGRVFIANRPELTLSRCEHHFIFILKRKDACPLILAVFHECMDLTARLRERLNPGDATW